MSNIEARMSRLRRETQRGGLRGRQRSLLAERLAKLLPKKIAVLRITAGRDRLITAIRTLSKNGPKRFSYYTRSDGAYVVTRTR